MNRTTLMLASAFLVALSVVACTSLARSPVVAGGKSDVYRIGITGVT
ncbi:MAG: hypothetical protein HYR85_07460 [Planctomycetes bacterium]|nr:hypothetical protein [Planctomycetota bacterium]